MGGTPRARRYTFATSSTDRAEVLVSDGTATDHTVTIDGMRHSARVDVADAGTARLELDGTSSTWAVARDGDTLWLGQRGFSWPLGIVSRETQIAEMLDGIERAEKPTRPEVRSPMPGTVVTVSVTDGAPVEQGDTILTVEAMKMEHRLTAPVAGIVRMTAAPGDLVRLDQLLATISTDPINTDQFSTKEES